MPKRGASAAAGPEHIRQEAAIVFDLLIVACSRLFSSGSAPHWFTPDDGRVALCSYAGDRREEPGVVEDAPSRQGTWPSM
jgi:hypothetical protein